MTDLRSLQHALGGEIVNGRQLLCPGPGHSPRDRSLSVWLTADGDIKVHSHAGDDWHVCKDYVRERLGWPQWRPGDGYDRRVDSSRLKAFDRAAIEAESESRPRTRRRACYGSNAPSRSGTPPSIRAAPRPNSICARARSPSTMTWPTPSCGSIGNCPWRDEDSGQTIFISALIAAFTSIDDDTVTAIHRIRVDQPQRWPKADR